MKDPKASTKDALLDAAEELFAEKGFAAVGNRELVARAGANVSAINYHFGSKQGLYEAAIRRSLQQKELLDVWDVLRDPPEEPAAAATLILACFLRGMLTALMADRDLTNCSKLIMREAIRPTALVGHIVDELFRPYDELAAAVIQRIAPELSDEDALLAVWCTLGQLWHLYLFRPFYESGEPGSDPAFFNAERISAYMIRYSLRGLGRSEEQIRCALEGLQDDQGNSQS